MDPQVPGNDFFDELNATMSKLSIRAKQTFILNDLHECSICKTPTKRREDSKIIWLKSMVLKRALSFFGVTHVTKKLTIKKNILVT